MNAVILAAGRGERLRPLTDTAPKCLTLVGGKSILQYELEALDAAGIQECTIVVGYRGSQVNEAFGASYNGLALRYVDNRDYGSTNNLYSLWLAREYLQSQTLLIEGDLLFNHELIQKLVDDPAEDVAVVDTFTDDMNGTIIRGQGTVITEFVLKSAQGEGYDYTGAAKTVNIYKFSESTMRNHFLPGLDRYVVEKQTNIFYEAVLAELVGSKALRMSILYSGDCPWFEIDTPEDLVTAESMFKTR